jgi:uncharacterized membrane protein YeaQ/YmgE (transglycosylase-associated protein family)
MGIASWVVVGLIAGWLAGQVMEGSGLGPVGDIVIGAIGALVGGWLAGTLFNVKDAISGLSPTTIIVAFLGAVVVLFVVRLIKRLLGTSARVPRR